MDIVTVRLLAAVALLVMGLSFLGAAQLLRRREARP